MITGYVFNPSLDAPCWPKNVRRRLVVGKLPKPKPHQYYHEVQLFDGSYVEIKTGQYVQYDPALGAIGVTDEQSEQIIDDRVEPHEPMCGFERNKSDERASVD